MGYEIKLDELMDLEKSKKHEPALRAYFEQGGTWQDLLKFDNNTMEAQYKVGFDLYQSADFKKAGGVFSYLTILNPYEEKYWMGLGLSKQSQKLFEEAVVAYLVVEAVTPQNPRPHLNLAQCFHALKESDDVKKHLKKAVALSAMKAEYQQINRDAQHLLDNYPKN